MTQSILQVIIMDLSKKILAILAIFCVIASAGAVCATDNLGYADDMGGYDGSNYSDGVYAADDSGYAEATIKMTVELQQTTADMREATIRTMAVGPEANTMKL